MTKKKKDTKQWYDVHFSLNGFMKIEADNKEEAMEKCEEILNDSIGSVESALNTGIGIEVYEAIGEDEQ